MEGAALSDIADAVGTPVYVYSSEYIVDRLNAFATAFAGVPHRVHYSVKANSNLAILALCHAQGAGFDIVSGGELSRVLAAGGNAEDVIFSGVGKSTEEIDFALKVGIGCFNVESPGEMARIANRASVLGTTAPVSIRVNPDVDPKTHPYISTGLQQNKFGVPVEAALDLYRDAASNPTLSIRGIDCHIGSQITSPEPLLEALSCLIDLIDKLANEGIDIEHVDLGGGMGIRYSDETPLDLENYGRQVADLMSGRPQQILLEPGRSIVANSGVLLTRVEYLKVAGKTNAPNFAVVDAAMNDLIRPALYQAEHTVVPVTESPAEEQNWDIVGPVCESADFLAKNRLLALNEGDLVAVTTTGAYGMVQASNYNSRNRACEVLVNGDAFSVVRRRETIEDQLRLERLPDET